MYESCFDILSQKADSRPYVGIWYMFLGSAPKTNTSFRRGSGSLSCQTKGCLSLWSGSGHRASKVCKQLAGLPWFLANAFRVGKGAQHSENNLFCFI